MDNSEKTKRKSKRQVILAAAEDLFTRFGAKRVSVEEICRAAGSSKMTFYRYFKDKTDLVKTIHDELVERSFTTFDEINARSIPFVEKIELMGLWKQQYMSKLDAGFFKELISIEHSMEEHKRRYMRNIAQAQEEGEVRKDIDPEFLWLLLDAISGMFKGEQIRAVCPDLGEAQRQLRAIIWEGLLVRGHAKAGPGIVREGDSRC